MTSHLEVHGTILYHHGTMDLLTSAAPFPASPTRRPVGLQIALASAPVTPIPTDRLCGPSGNKLFPLAPTAALQNWSTAQSQQRAKNSVTFCTALRSLEWKVMRAGNPCTCHRNSHRLWVKVALKILSRTTPIPPHLASVQHDWPAFELKWLPSISTDTPQSV